MRFRKDTWDKGIFNMVSRGNEYKLPADLSSYKTIIDVGAHIGSFVHACATRGFTGLIRAIEANPENAALLEENVRWMQQRGILRCEVGMSNLAVHRSDEYLLPIMRQPAKLPSNTGGCPVSGLEQFPVKIRTVPFDALVTATAVHTGCVDLVKLDCEGSEWPILFTSKKLDLIRWVVGEFHPLPGPWIESRPWCRVEPFKSFGHEELRKLLVDSGFDQVHVDRRNGIGKFSARRTSAR